MVAILPGSHYDGAGDYVEGGALAQCFVNGVTPRCTYGVPKSDEDWLSTPVELESGPDIVYAGAGDTRPMLMIQTGSAPSANGNYSIDTELFSYDRCSNEFRSVFANLTYSKSNQETRFMQQGPLRGDVIVDFPSGSSSFIQIYKPDASGLYAPILGYQGHAVYGDGNELPVSDSEMPEILRRLGLWHQGDALPVPRRGCTPVMRRGVEWCK